MNSEFTGGDLNEYHTYVPVEKYVAISIVGPQLI